MKKNYIGFFFLLIATAGFSQKAKIDKYRIPVQEARFPTFDLTLDQRNYKLEYQGNPYFESSIEGLEIKNMELREKDNSILLSLKGSSMSFTRKPKVSSRKVVKKDDDGKVISSTTYYKATASNSGFAVLNVFGDEEISRFIHMSKRSLELEAKREAKAEMARIRKEEKAKSKEVKNVVPEKVNPFLTNVDTSSSNANSNEIDEEKTVETTSLYSTKFSKVYQYKGLESRSQAATIKSASELRANNFENDQMRYLEYLTAELPRRAHSLFNYSKSVAYSTFYIMDAKKHPENEMFIQATEAAKLILGKLRYNKPSDEVAKEIAPIISYYQSMAEKYSINDKKNKAIRTAALVNLGRINYFLENINELNSIGEQLILDSHKKSIGEQFVEKSDYLTQRRSFYDGSLRYPINFDESEDTEEFDFESESDDFD